jgi:MFS transporter, ACS family, pantothenate transporter
MSLPISYYAKNIFASSYGKDRPKFFFWYPEGTSVFEKKLLFKIDFFILTYGCLSYFTKWLDTANLSNAYVSGMQQDLAMYGTQYNLAVTCFSAGQIIGAIPANILLTWIPPRILLPGLELAWAILTIGTYAVRDVNQVCFRAMHFREIHRQISPWISAKLSQSYIPFAFSSASWKAPVSSVCSMFLAVGIRRQN